jgi:hypothetical protein
MALMGLPLGKALPVEQRNREKRQVYPDSLMNLRQFLPRAAKIDDTPDPS